MSFNSFNPKQIFFQRGLFTNKKWRNYDSFSDILLNWALGQGIINKDICCPVVSHYDLSAGGTFTTATLTSIVIGGVTYTFPSTPIADITVLASTLNTLGLGTFTVVLSTKHLNVPQNSVVYGTITTNNGTYNPIAGA